MRLTLVTVYILFLFVLFESASRLFLKFKFDADFFSPKSIIYYYYPQLRPIDVRPISEANRTFDVLLLGGSVLSKQYGGIEDELRTVLHRLSKDSVVIYNLGIPAHSSMDSRIKLEWLEDKNFDLIILYDGINDVRANNCPNSIFKENYLHYKWYSSIWPILNHPELNYTTLPYLMELFLSEAEKKLTPESDISMQRPRQEWIQYGSTIKTTSEFKKNIKYIVCTAQRKQIPIIVMTFAYHIPPNYSLKEFEQKQLDYSAHTSAIEIWGAPDNVKLALDAHNVVIYDVYAENSGGKIFFVDMNNLLPKNKLYFNDVCHLTSRGCKEFVEKLIPSLEKIIDQNDKSTADWQHL